MPFDPNVPRPGQPLDAGVVRNQFTSLKALIDALTSRVAALEPPPPLEYGPGQATNPSPADGATGVARNFDLYAWLPEQSAKIYWGDSPGTLAHLTDATGPNIGLLGALMIMQLDANATYYWRVDLWNTSDDTTITGEVWHFTTGAM